MKAVLRRFIARLFEHQVRRVIGRHRLKVVAVAGSVGKTSTKAAITRVLAQKYRVLSHQGGYNSEIGLPLSVFEMSVPGWLFNPFAWAWRLAKSELIIRKYPYEILILELGTDHPGEMARFLAYLTPDVGVITAVTAEHMANFPGGLDEVAHEELQLAARCTYVLASRDEIDAAYRRRYLDSHPHHAYYGAAVRKGYRFARTSTAPLAGTKLDILRDGQHLAKGVNIQLYGEPACKSVVAAYAVGEYFRLSRRQIIAGLAEFQPVPGRLNPLAGANRSILLDDSYNAQPAAVLAALRELAAAPATRRIAVLGSMNELGAESQAYHEEVGAAAAGVDLLITIGADANRWLGPAAVAAGLDPGRHQPANSPYAAGEHLRPMLEPGDLVLIKGSQNGVFSEEATKLLLADPADAAHLVRQSPAWQRIKRRQFADTPRG
jgi:UDP-N-acetylmuramoyl-tripeptide--D-alanyl-D-alanine ligase